MIKKNVFFFPIWGKSYIKNFSKYALPCLLNNLKNIKKSKLQGSKIEIWTKKKDVKELLSLSILKKIKDIIDINFTEIDILLNSLKSENLSKYQTLSILQRILISSSSRKYQYVWFIYPDFIFSANLLKNIFNLGKDYNAYFIPVPQIIEEKVNEIAQTNKVFLNKNYDIKKLIYNNIHPIVKICDIDKLKTNTPSMYYKKKNNIIALRYYHMHPLILKLDKDNFNIHTFAFNSLDADLPAILNEKKFFITKSDKFACCASLLKKDEIKLPNEVSNLELTKLWIAQNTYPQHHFISKFTYYLNPYNLRINKKYFENKFKKKLNVINKDFLTHFNKSINKFRFFSDDKSHAINISKSLNEIIHKNEFTCIFKINKKALIKKLTTVSKSFKSDLSKKILNIYLNNLP